MKRTLLLCAMIIGYYTTASSQTLDQSYTTGIGATFTNGPYSPTEGTGQTFTAGVTGQLSLIVIQVTSLTAPGTLQLQIFSGSTWSGTALTTETYYVAATGPYQMYINPGVSITSGSQYTFILSNPTGPSAGDFGFKDDFNGAYAGGTEWYQGASVATRDMAFQTYTGNVGVQEIKPASLYLNAFPDPFTSHLTINADNSAETVTVLNVLGAAVAYAEVRNGNAELELAELPDGIYFVEVRSSSAVSVQKVVKN